jgi:hypothetical protein
MVESTEVLSILITKSMDKACLHGQMVTNTMAILRMTKHTATAHGLGLIAVISILANGRRINKVDTVQCTGKMAEHMWARGMMAKEMDMVFSHGRIWINTMANGEMIE